MSRISIICSWNSATELVSATHTENYSKKCIFYFPKFPFFLNNSPGVKISRRVFLCKRVEHKTRFKTEESVYTIKGFIIEFITCNFIPSLRKVLKALRIASLCDLYQSYKSTKIFSFAQKYLEGISWTFSAIFSKIWWNFSVKKTLQL